MEKKNLLTLIIERLEKQDEINSDVVALFKLAHETESLLSKRMDLLTQRVDLIENTLKTLLKTILKAIENEHKRSESKE